MKILNYIFRKILMPACGIFTIVVFVYLLAGIADNSINTPAIPWQSLLLFFGFSLCYSLCSMVFGLKEQWGKYVAIGSHFLLTTACVAIFFIAIGGHAKGIEGKGAIAFLIIYLLCYAIVLPIYLLATSNPEAKEKTESQYTNRFK